MIYSIRHITQFHYSAPITESMMEVRMQPRRAVGQHCLSFELLTEPRAYLTTTRDYLGNIVHHFDVPRIHTKLEIVAQAVVDVSASPPLPDALGTGAWDELDGLVQEGEGLEMLMPSAFATPTTLLRELGRELDVRRRANPLTVLYQINAGLGTMLTYLPQSTQVDSPLDDALRQRAGVCQDFAHIMIALVRDVGIPCRYVSGYVYQGTDEPHPERVAATHAWVEALVPKFGWVGFDPTNNTIVSDQHIGVAIGRDYADVPPTRGVFKGEAATELGVAVQVVRGERLPQHDDMSLVVKHVAPQTRDGDQPQQQQQVGMSPTLKVN